jgi:coenzyme F420 hydrogenase subunit beta
MVSSFQVLSSSVIDNEFCCGCGACVGVCPAEALAIDIFRSHEPVLDESRCTDCGLCFDVCPGKGYAVAGPARESCGGMSRMIPERGPTIENMLGYSTDPDIRYASASGGIATALMIHLLETGQVDSVLVIGMENERPAARLTDDIREVRDAVGSKYGPVPMLTDLIRALAERPRRIAVSFTPCQLAGWRAARERIPELRKSSVIAIGLFCGYIQSYDSLTGIASTLGIEYPGGARFTHWRYGAYPGSVRFELIDGTSVEKSNRDSHAVAVPYYSLHRCFLCPEGGNWLSDITLGDIHGSGEGETVIVCRTSKGKEILESARKAGRIAVREMTPNQVERHVIRNITRFKLMASLAAIVWRRRRGMPVPEFDYDETSVQRGRMKKRALYWVMKYRLILWCRTDWRWRFLLRHPSLMERVGHFLYTLPGSIPGWKLMIRVRSLFRS